LSKTAYSAKLRSSWNLNIQNSKTASKEILKKLKNPCTTN
jgi:hypothetical protein